MTPSRISAGSARAHGVSAAISPPGGLGTREQLLEAYARASGFRVDPAHLLFWEALGTYKVALVFVRQSWVYLAGHYRSLELASLGRRIAEAEEELVRLMEESP